MVTDSIHARTEQRILTTLARRDVNIFIERVMKDQTGRPLMQAPIHRSWQRFIDHCRQQCKHAMIIAPWGHGKTIQVLGRALWELSRNPNLRIKLVCCDDRLATDRVQTLARYIEGDPDFQAVFPDIRPDPAGSWAQQRLDVIRSAPLPDASVEAKGILSSGIGGRTDLLIVDDPHDLRTGVLEPSRRQAVIGTFHNVWLSRLEPTGQCIYIATVWHEEDLTHVLAQNPSFGVLAQAISEDYDGIVQATNLPTFTPPTVGSALA